MSSIYGECHDTVRAGRCGSKECRLFQNGGCEVGAEVIEAEQDSMPREEYEEYCIMYKIQLEKPMNVNNKVSGRVETKGLFRTAYDIGDTFWAMHHNAPLELKLYSIELYVNSREVIVKYSLCEPNDSIFDKVTEEALSKFCRTKEELMSRVFAGDSDE